MNQNLKARLINNHFVYGLRLELRIDMAAYEHLCNDLKILATEWKFKSEIDKELMQCLLSISLTTKANAHLLPENQDKLEEMIAEIDTLIELCLLGSTEIETKPE